MKYIPTRKYFFQTEFDRRSVGNGYRINARESLPYITLESKTEVYSLPIIYNGQKMKGGEQR